MCGIAGVWRTGGDLVRTIEAMCKSMVHRGPDADGFWVDDVSGIALGHRRLSIVDLSETGHQPMSSSCKRFTITYNGELYNTAELREALVRKGFAFRGTSDTEVVVNAISAWGIEDAARKFNGIFAFGVWDRKERCLMLVRDRVGVKPLYWSRYNGHFAFASELRAIATIEDFDRTLDRSAMGAFLQNNYIPVPLTIYKDVRALEPGTIMSVRSGGAIATVRYWDLAETVSELAPQRAKDIDAQAAIEELGLLLRDAVARQLVSDVPIGAFLSGGIDSSTVVALMQQVSPSPVRTFSIGFESKELDEAVAAKQVSKHLGTRHRELYVSDRDVLDSIPRLSSIFDQPLADVSCAPMYLLSKMASEEVTVALSGDGGDELFYGYDRFIAACNLQRKLKLVPRSARRATARLLDDIGARQFRHNGFQRPGKASRTAWHAARIIDYAKDDPSNTYLHFITHWPEPERLIDGTARNVDSWNRSKAATPEFYDRVMLHDAMNFMTDQVLAKVDRASMAVSLEARVPLLDHRVIEMAWRLPFSLKYRGGKGKWCLREVLHRHVPQALVDRPKSGFQPPIGAWLRGPLRDWAEYLLSENTMVKWDVLNPRPARQLWSAHLEGQVDASSQLWSLLSLQSWLENVHGILPKENFVRHHTLADGGIS